MRRTALALVVTVLASSAAAVDIDAVARDYVATRAAEWMANPALLTAIEAGNAAHAGLDAAAILALDGAWRAEIGQPAQPTIQPVLENPASDALRAIIHSAGGTIAEIFVMDNRGLNVAMADTTSDYWQGDEAKFAETFPLGAGAIHAGEVDFDESSQAFEIQISFTFTDAAGAPVGAMTVALNAEALD